LFVGLTAIGLNVLVDVENPEHVPAQVSFVTYALGQVSREEFIARMGRGMFEPIVWMNHNLPAGPKVLYVGEARAYYARQQVLWSTAFDQHPLTTMNNWNAITHVYINTSELNRLHTNYGYLREADLERLTGLLDNRARLIHQSGRSAVYELEPAR